MAQTGFTPIQHYYSITSTNVPLAANLALGEWGLNIADADMSAYLKNASGTVRRFFNNPAALRYPTADGTSGQVMTTDGAGNLSFSSASVTGAGNNAFTGANTFYNATGQTFGTATAAQDGLVLAGRAGGTGTFRVTLSPSTLTASRAVTFPDAAGSVAVSGARTEFTVPQRPSLAAETAPTTNALTWDLTTNTVMRVNLNANIITFNLTGTLSTLAGYQYQLVVRYNGGTTITWPASVKWPAGTAPTLTGTSGKVDVFNFVVASSDGGTTFFLLSTGSSQNL